MRYFICLLDYSGDLGWIEFRDDLEEQEDEGGLWGCSGGLFYDSGWEQEEQQEEDGWGLAWVGMDLEGRIGVWGCW